MCGQACSPVCTSSLTLTCCPHWEEAARKGATTGRGSQDGDDSCLSLSCRPSHSALPPLAQPHGHPTFCMPPAHRSCPPVLAPFRILRPTCPHMSSLSARTSFPPPPPPPPRVCL